MRGILHATALAGLLLAAQPASAIDPPQPFPGAAPGGTDFLNKSALLGPVNDPDWFLHNIPFLDVPDSLIQQVYYYRWQTYKEHLIYTGSIYGWLSTEFLAPVSYGAPYGGVDAAAGHQTIEGRWLRDQQYVKDNINYWLDGPGQFPKPQNYADNPDTSDWAHEYSFWIASAVWQVYLAHGDLGFAKSQLDHLVTQYRGWDNHYNSTLGLYWQVPVWDATEFTPASYESSDPYHGGAGYRPTINAYQFGDATAIASIAALSGDGATTFDYLKRAASLRRNMQARLWDPNRHFFYDMPRDNNPTMALLDTREEEGFVPWMFDAALPQDAIALAELKDPEGFAAQFGPTTAERRSRWFDYQDANCCHWDGPSWPYETAQTLTGLANLLDDYPPQLTFTQGDYVNALHTYAATQFRNGVPYVAEAHDADANDWIYDSYDHSEDYNHSTFNDNVIAGLIGLRGEPGDVLVLRPLAPASWDYFALENAPYHGHNVTVLWDRGGARYKQGAGLSVYVDGKRVAARPTLGVLAVDVGHPITQSNACGVVDIATNSQRFAYGTQPFASYTSPYDDVWRGIDGVVYRTGIPENSRWTSYASPNPTDYYGIDFQRDVTLSDVRVTFYDDGGGVRVPNSYDLQYWTGTAWATVPNQVRQDPAPVANATNRITFPPLTTSRIRVLAANAGGGTGWGIQELQAFSRPIFQISNVNSGLVLGVQAASRADGAQVKQFQDTGTNDHLWILADAGGGSFTIRNMNSGLVLGVSGNSTADSALIAQQQSGDGASSQLWSFIDRGNGQFLIRNKHSGLVLGVSQESHDSGANVVQFEDNGTPDHLWLMESARDPLNAAGDAGCPTP
ncbi:MGH1-like glycoside hydrolase domain-containing protein [Lichenicoccus sp.]|uniref:MGH1-like glycoside hydrolase domain-containing protein n=1 Tax=Lichenicoccus sp. TaxID=2781899 RepID=UPI003D0E00BE